MYDSDVIEEEGIYSVILFELIGFRLWSYDGVGCI